MKLKNIFQMNDWKIKNFFIMIFLFGSCFYCTYFLDYIGFHLPILKEVFSLIFILFLPGILILRILRVHNIKTNSETILYGIGISVTTLFLIGTIVNTFFPLFGISKPLSPKIILLTYTIILSLLCIFCYIRDKNFSNERFINIQLTPGLILISFLPLLSIWGAFLMNTYQNNYLTILFILLSALIIILISFNKLIPEKYYPIALFLITISVLYHKSLITSYIWGWDITSEYYISNLVLQSSYWNLAIADSNNSMLSVTILPQMIYIFTKMDLLWVYKVVYPLIFSLVPFGLYTLFKKQTSEKIAFLSVIFFVSTFVFHTEMLTICKQEVAELFIVLIFLLMINKEINPMKKSLISIFFMFSLVTSHYGLSYIFILIISIALLFYIIKNRFYDTISRIPFFLYLKNENLNNGKTNQILTISFFLLLSIIALTWYIYVSGSSPFSSIVHAGDQIASNLYSLMDPEKTQGLNILVSQQQSLLRILNKYLYLIAEFFISVGVILVLFKKDGMSFTNEFKMLIISTYSLLILAITVPFFSSQLNTTRLFHISLIILSPLLIVGIIKSINFLNHFWSSLNINNEKSFKIVSMFLVLFFLFDMGLFYQISNEDSTSIALNANLDFPKFNEKELTSVEWLKIHRDSNIIIFADKYRISLLSSVFYRKEIKKIPYFQEKIRVDYYLYLGTYNVLKNQILISIIKTVTSEEKYVDYEYLVQNKTKIYDNGGSFIFN